MGRRTTSSGDYNLNQSFSSEGSTYTTAAASKLAAWVRFVASAPTDLGPNGLTCAYDGTVSTSEATVGNTNRNIATFSNAANKNARITPAAGELSMTSGTDETLGAGTDETDLPFSVSLWANHLNLSSTTYMFGKTGGKWYATSRSDSTIEFSLDVGFGNYSLIRTNAGSWYPPTGEWIHYVFTYDGRGGSSAYEGLKIYVNGTEAVSTGLSVGTYDGSDYDPDGALFIGGAPGSGSSEFNGDMAEFAVWRNHELTPSEVKAIYRGSSSGQASLLSFLSGISSVPAKLQIRAKDQLGGQYPTNYRLGDHDAQRSINSLPFDDTNTQTFLSNYATAKIFLSQREDGPIFPGTYIDLTGSNGNTSKRFKFIQSLAIPGCTVASSDVKIILTSTPATPIEERIRNVANRLAIAIRKQSDLEIDVDHRSPVVESYDEEGEKLVNRSIRHTLVLKHKVPGRGSYDQGNRIVTKIPLPGGTGEGSNPPGIKTTQFKIQTTKPITLGTLKSFDGDESSIVSVGHSSPGIISSGSMIPGVTDATYVPRTNYVLSPFDESRIPSFEEDQYHIQGTPRTILEGFESKLSSKTIVKIKCKSSNGSGDPIFYASGAVGEAPLGTYTPAVQGRIGSGFAYWNKALGTWEMKATDISREEVSAFAANTALRAKSALGFTLSPSSSTDTSQNYSFFRQNDFWNLDVINSLKGVSMPTSTYGFPQASQYNATSSQEILMSDHISYPFLLEKVKVKVKGIFGVATSSLNGSERTPINKTFFILNQRTSGDFSHVTGTMTVSNNRQTSALARFFEEEVSVDSRGNREIVSWGKIGFLDKDNYIFSQGNEANLNKLFNDYDLVKKFDKSIDNPAYTGSLSLSLVPKLALADDALSVSTVMDSFGYTRTIVQSNKHGGADLSGNASGRQIASSLGSAKTVGSGSSIYLYHEDVQLTEKESNYQQSPYLLLPEDRLVFGWQNVMPISAITNGAGYNSQVQGDLLVDRIEEVDVTLFGSMIRDSREFHDTLNQNISSDQIHEVIFGKHVVDQYDVEPITVLSGSTSDALFFGRSLSNESNVRGIRGRRASIAKGEAGSTGSLQRNIGIKSVGRFKDSLTPHLEYFLTHPTFFTSSATSKSGLSDTVIAGGTPRPSIVLSNNPISSSFKLLKFVGLHQLVNPRGLRSFDTSVRKFPASDFLTPPGSGKVTDAKFLSFDMSTSGAAKYKVFSGTLDYVKGVKSFGSPEVGTLPEISPPTLLQSTAQKLAISSLFFASPVISMFGKITWPVYPLGLGGVIPLIRGTRYGLSNTTPTSPVGYFRRSSYGQFRDLMEQHPETAVVDLIDEDTGEIDLEAADGPVRVRFFARNGTPDISPLDTNSQNLSQFATSSLPYYDGVVKERDVVTFPPPDDTDKIGVEEATLALVDGDA